MNKKNNSKDYTKVAITIDLGTSSQKGIAQIYPDGVPIVLAMEPEIADLGVESIEYLSNQLVQDTTVWIGIGSEYYVLGALAKSMFAGTSAIRDLKYQYALPKVAAMLWLAIRRLGVNIELYVHLLLPVGEASDGQTLRAKLAQNLKTGIITPTGRLKAKLRSFDVSPEGAGIMAYRSRNVNINYFQKSIGMLMLGYRNASFILSHKGNAIKAESTDLGMNWVVHQFVERTAVGLSKDDLRLISALEINADVELFCRILPIVRKEYCRALWRWLRNIAQMDEILVCGGTASFVRQELTEHFDSEGIPICWNGGMELPKYLDTMGLGDRIADAWASHISHIKFLDHELSYDRQDKPLVPDYYVQPFKSFKPDTEIWQRNGYITTSQK
jgi:hypothetical protein